MALNVKGCPSITGKHVHSQHVANVHRRLFVLTENKRSERSNVLLINAKARNLFGFQQILIAISLINSEQLNKAGMMNNMTKSLFIG